MSHFDTPASITPVILELCEELVPKAQPIYVEVKPAFDAQPLYCFPNVERQVEKAGGKLVYGWQVWEWPGLLVEAEFHAVWENPQRELKDLTPQEKPTERVLFLPDPSRVFTGRRMNNARKALSKNPAVAKHIKLWNQHYEFLDTRTDDQGQCSFSLADAARFKILQMQLGCSELKLLSLKPNAISLNAPCPCGSNKKYKRCCMPPRG